MKTKKWTARMTAVVASAAMALGAVTLVPLSAQADSSSANANGESTGSYTAAPLSATVLVTDLVSTPAEPEQPTNPAEPEQPTNNSDATDTADASNGTAPAASDNNVAAKSDAAHEPGNLAATGTSVAALIAAMTAILIAGITVNRKSRTINDDRAAKHASQW